MIIEPDTVCRQIERCDGIHEAGCEPSEPAVSQGWFEFDFLDLAQRFAVLCKDFFYLMIDLQIDQIVG